MDHTYTKHQLLRMERKVLCALHFDLSYCPPLHFLLLFASVARCSATVHPHPLRSTCCCVLVKVWADYAFRWCGWLVICWSSLCWRASVWCFCPYSWLEQPSAWPAKFYRSVRHQREKLRGVWLPASMLAGMKFIKLFLLISDNTHCFTLRTICSLFCSKWTFRATFSSEPTLLRIMHILASAAAKASSRETCATFIKFSTQETLKVSRHPGLKNATGLLGVYSWHMTYLPKLILDWYQLRFKALQSDRGQLCEKCLTVCWIMCLLAWDLAKSEANLF